MRGRTINSLGSPTQQGMTLDPRDQTSLNVNRLMLGVVLEVFPADNAQNRSSYQREDRRGYLHTATILVINNGRGAYFTLENVIITPDAVTGLDDYYERLPRGCTSLVTGETFNNQLNHINPYDLDGDWCVVACLGGSIDQPFILRWWPHPWNAYDPATSGQPNPNNTRQPDTLEQSGRFLHRINGVEFTITKPGNLYVSTYRANSSLTYGTPVAPVDGRFPRTLNDEEGGSIKLWIKPSQVFELDFDPQINGVGIEDMPDDELSQTNPSNQNTSNGEKNNTYCKYTKERIQITAPVEIKFVSKQRILLNSEEDTTLTVGNNFTVNTTGDTTVTSTGPLDITGQNTVDITATGPATIQGTVGITIAAGAVLGLSGSSLSLGAVGASPGTPGTMSINSAGILLGSGALGGAVGGTPLQTAFTAFKTQVTAAAATATFDTTAWSQLVTAVNALELAIAASVSSTTRVG